MTEGRSTHTEEREKNPGPWRPTNRPVLWAIGLVVALVTIILLVANLYPDIWQAPSTERVMLIGIGVALVAVIVLLAIGGASLRWTGFADKTLWEWLQLLGALAIPVVLATAGFWFTTQQEARQEKIEALRAESERQIEEQRAQDAALQAYLDQMSTFLLDKEQRKDLRNSGGNSGVLTVARAHTVTVIQRLDADRNRSVIRFLNEARLTESGLSSISLLAGADLQGAHLEGVDFATTLSDADLFDANLRHANLNNASGGVTEKWLEFTKASLEGATMPDGTLYERYATRKFEPALSFSPSHDWKRTSPERTDEVNIATGPKGVFNFSIANPRHALDPSRPTEEVRAPENAEEWVSRFRSNPNLDTSEPVPVSVGDASGMQIDVTYGSTPENFPQEFCKKPCVPLYPTNESVFIIYEGYKDRSVIVDIGDETVIIGYGAPADNFDEFVPQAQKVLDSVEWEGG